MKNGNLVIMRMVDGEYSHAVILAGYQIFSEAEGGYYYLMDPNKGVFVSVSINGSQYKTGKDIHYATTYGYNFTWFDSMYTK